MGRPRKKADAFSKEEGGSGEKASLTLFVVEGPCEGLIFSAKTNRVTVGRTKVNNFAVKDLEVSQRHAVFEWSADHWIIIDVGSSFGTFVNRKQISEGEAVKLDNEDMVQLGSNSYIRVEIRLPLHPHTTVQQWLELETEVYVKRLQATVDRVEREMREANQAIMAPLLERVALVTTKT